MLRISRPQTPLSGPTSQRKLSLAGLWSRDWCDPVAPAFPKPGPTNAVLGSLNFSPKAEEASPPHEGHENEVVYNPIRHCDREDEGHYELGLPSRGDHVSKKIERSTNSLSIEVPEGRHKDRFSSFTLAPLKASQSASFLEYPFEAFVPVMNDGRRDKRTLVGDVHTAETYISTRRDD